MRCSKIGSSGATSTTIDGRRKDDPYSKVIIRDLLSGEQIDPQSRE
jgi:hypothetical protein